MKPETSHELRGLVREVLKEAMANRGLPAQGTETVRISNDAELQAFVGRLSKPGVIDAVRAGKLRFTLGQTPHLFPASQATFSKVSSLSKKFQVWQQREPSFWAPLPFLRRWPATGPANLV